MYKVLLIGAAMGAAAATPSLAANAGFHGNFVNSNAPAAPGGRCPALTVNIGNSPPFFATGTSNFGAFTSVQSHCLNSGPPVMIGAASVPYYDGLFDFTFAGGSALSGTYAGLLTNAGAPGIVDNVQHFIITGGTGIFANATGSFEGIGQIKFGAGPPTATLAISNGVIVAPGVVEPATWGMMLTGFGVIGTAMRSRRKPALGSA